MCLRLKVFQRAMKVLMLGWELPPHNSGGMGVACYQLCKALSARGVAIEFIVPYTAEHGIDFMHITAAQPSDANAIFNVTGIYDSYKYVAKNGDENDISVMELQARYTEAVEKIVTEASFDVIHAHDWLTCRAAIRAKEITGKPLIVHIHATEADRSGQPLHGNPMVREIEENALLVADKIVAVSEFTKRIIMREYDIPADKIEVVHNSIDVKDMEPLDTTNAYGYLEKMKQDGYKIVANVGRFTIQKNLPNLLRAMRTVIECEPKTLLLLVGGGDQLHELIRMSADLGMARNVLFTDFQRGKRWRDAYAIADLFVMPSVSEPFGLTPLEAVAYGTPALISRQSGVSEVLFSCLKVDFWDIREMANQILSAVRSQPLLDTMQANAYEEYKRLSWNTSADKIIDTYRLQLGRAVA